MQVTATRIHSDDKNPDAGLAVQFYKRSIENEFQSEQNKRPIFESRDFVKIWSPGNVLNIIDTFVTEDHKRRFPLQWQAYSNRMEGSDLDTREVGTPITVWPRITREQAEELRGLKFYTVEAVANASDAQLQSVGMIAGMSAFSFRDEARRFLSVADAAAKLAEADRKLAEATASSAAAALDSQQRIAALEKRLELAVERAEAGPTVDAPRGPGRPPKG